MPTIQKDIGLIVFPCGCLVQDAKTFSEWQQCGYIVKKGEKAFKLTVTFDCTRDFLHFQKPFYVQVFCPCQVVKPKKKE